MDLRDSGGGVEKESDECPLEPKIDQGETDEVPHCKTDMNKYMHRISNIASNETAKLQTMESKTLKLLVTS